MIIKTYYCCSHCKQSFKDESECLIHESTCKQMRIDKGRQIALRITNQIYEARAEGIAIGLESVNYDVENDLISVITQNNNKSADSRKGNIKI